MKGEEIAMSNCVRAMWLRNGRLEGAWEWRKEGEDWRRGKEGEPTPEITARDCSIAPPSNGETIFHPDRSI